MMAAARYALVQKLAPRTVMNVVEWDGDTTTWAPPADQDAIQSDVANPGDTYDDASGTFIAGPAPAPDPLAASIQRCRDYVLSTVAGDTADQLNTYLANAAPTNAQSVAAVKETIRTLRALIRIVRNMGSGA